MKKITSIFAMLCIALSGVAQEATPDTDYGTRLTPDQFNEITTATKIAIECTQIDNYGQFYNGSGKSATLTENSIYVLEPVVENTPGLYYIKRENGTGENVYWSSSSPSNNACVSKANAQKFKATSVVPNTLDSYKYPDYDIYGIRITFEDGSKWLRLSAAHDFAANNATGVWTVQNVYKVSKVTINEVKDGATTTNVQYCLSSSKSYEIPQHVGYSYTVQAEGVAEDATSFTATNASDITVTVTYTAANPEAALASLQETLDEADAIVWGTTIGYYEKTDAIAKAIADAQKLVDDESTDIDAIEEATVALKEAIAKPSLILPEAGKFYTIKGSSGGYLTGKASTAYSSRGKIGLVDDYDEDYVFYYTDSKLVCYGTGLCLSHVAGGNHQAIANAFKGAAVDVTFEKSFGSATAQGAKLFVKFADGHVIKDLSNGADRDDIGCNANTPESAQWTIAEVTTLPLAISEAGYASFYAPVAVRLPEEGLEAYAVESVSGDAAMLKAVEGVVPANTGVILKGAAGDYELNITESNAVAETLLKGSVASEYVDADAYVLATKDDVVGLYKAKKTVSTDTTNDGEEGTEDDTFESFVNNGFKAYLPAEGTAGARLLFDFGTETAIESIQGAESASAVVYDLAGRRVKGAQKGLYIVNGKVVIK